MSKDVSICVVVSIIIGIFATSASFASEPPTSDFLVFKNQPVANDLRMITADNRIINLSDFKGNVILLNFWRKDCQFCEFEKHHLKSMVQSLGSDKVKVICANFWDQPSWVRQYGKQNGGSLIFAARPEGSKAVVENVVRGRLMGYYILNQANEAVYEIRGFPSTYVIDQDGRIIAAHLGLAQWNSRPIRNWIAEMADSAKKTDKASSSDDLPDWIERLLTNGFVRIR